MKKVTTRKRSIGVFGGTFDPPHLGHLVVADRVRDELGLDEVRLVVANQPWQKAGTREITKAEDRYRLVTAAVGACSGLVVSRTELDAGGPSYSIDTLGRYKAAETEPTDWHLIVGADAAAGLDTWHRADELRSAASIVVVNRPGSQRGAVAPKGWRGTAVDVPALDISSTDLRDRVARGLSIRFLTPDAVIALVDVLGIYRQTS